MNSTPHTEFWSKKRVFITGHTGFKGSWMTFWLYTLGSKITGLSLQPSTKPSLFEALNLSEFCDSIIADIRDHYAVQHAILQAQPEIIFHMAAQPIVSKGYTDPRETFETNVMGTVNLLEACRNITWPCCILIVSSDKCYENLDVKTPFKVGDPMGGKDPYSASKGCTELAFNAYRQSFFQSGAIRVASARAGNVIGGGDWSPDRLLVDGAISLSNRETFKLRHPKAVRPWQHVLEPLAGYMRLIELLGKQPGFSGSWNFGPKLGESKSVLEIAKIFCDVWGEDANYDMSGLQVGKEANYLSLDCLDTFERLDWHPKLDTEAAVRWTANWYKTYYKDSSIDQVQKICRNQILHYENLN